LPPLEPHAAGSHCSSVARRGNWKRKWPSLRPGSSGCCGWSKIEKRERLALLLALVVLVLVLVPLVVPLPAPTRHRVLKMLVAWRVVAATNLPALGWVKFLLFVVMVVAAVVVVMLSWTEVIFAVVVVVMVAKEAAKPKVVVVVVVTAVVVPVVAHHHHHHQATTLAEFSGSWRGRPWRSTAPLQTSRSKATGCRG
jgi:hypothetical protein